MMLPYLLTFLLLATSSFHTAAQDNAERQSRRRSGAQQTEKILAAVSASVSAPVKASQNTHGSLDQIDVHVDCSKLINIDASTTQTQITAEEDQAATAEHNNQIAQEQAKLLARKTHHKTIDPKQIEASIKKLNVENQVPHVLIKNEQKTIPKQATTKPPPSALRKHFSPDPTSLGSVILQR
jgi:hypothetical protein